MYREDYARAGYFVLPRNERAKDRLVNWQTMLPLLLLVPASLLPVSTNKASVQYYIGAVLLCGAFLYYGAQLIRRKSNSSARQLLSASILYLPSLFVLMIVLRK
jgi:heme O synthase-like polyprenyltransferase